MSTLAYSGVRSRFVAVGGAIAVLSAACSPSAGAQLSNPRDAVLDQSVPSHVTVAVAHIARLGTVLVDGTGHALYMFPPDAGSRVTCVGSCAGTWPPLVIAGGDKPASGAGVNGEDLSTLHDPNTGARIVTYAGYPLYRYAGDTSAHTANGQALFNAGGPWYVLDARGQPVTTDPGETR